MNDPKEVVFSSEEIHSFYKWLISRHQNLEIEFPEGAGWRLVDELRGDNQDNAPSPVLFKIYEREREDRLVIISNFLLQSFKKHSGASDLSPIDPTDPKTIQKSIQINRVRDWMALFARCSSVDFETMTEDFKKTELMMIGTMAWDVIKRDLITLEGDEESDSQELRSKEAGTAYQSGLINFLVATGRRSKKGNRRGNSKSDKLPWEFTAVKSTWQFVARHYELPSQAWLRKQLESEGISYNTGRGRDNSSWRALFKRAGLDTLKLV
jgi:hypothetical protein